MSTATLPRRNRGAARLDWPVPHRWRCSATRGAGRAGAARRAAGRRPLLVVLGFALGVAFLKAEFRFTASWRRFLVRGEAGGMLGGLLLIAVAALRHRAGRGARSRLRRRDCADRAVAHRRRVRVRHRHAARQRLRLRHALHGRRRLRAHADRARPVHRRQRGRQFAPAGLSGARRDRSRFSRRITSGPGAALR